MSWKEFADALDQFKGTGLGAFEPRKVVGKRNGKPLCRYCALGAAYRAVGNAGVFPISGIIGENFGFKRAEWEQIILENDNFANGSESPIQRSNRLRFMRAYARARANGVTQGKASRDALDLVHPLKQ